MAYVIFVEVRNSFNQLPKYDFTFIFFKFKALFLFNVMVETFTLAQFHDQVNVASCVNHLVQSHDVRMVNLWQDVDLLV